MAQRRNTSTVLHKHNSPARFSFLTPKISAKFDRGQPLRGRQMQVGLVKIDDCRQKITGYILKTLQDGRVVSIKVEYEVVCALSNGYDLEWLLTAQTTPISAFCTAFHIFVVGVVRNFKFGLYRLTKASPSLLTTSHLWNGRGQGHVTHFYILCPRPYLWSEWS